MVETLKPREKRTFYTKIVCSMYNNWIIKLNFGEILSGDSIGFAHSKKLELELTAPKFSLKTDNREM